jgi:hypothetical protein
MNEQQRKRARYDLDKGISEEEENKSSLTDSDTEVMQESELEGEVFVKVCFFV